MWGGGRNRITGQDTGPFRVFHLIANNRGTYDSDIIGSIKHKI